jgi:hypothetical protein
MYRYDASYAVEVQRAHPGRLAIVKPVDPDDPAVGDIIADWKQTPGAVGIRVMMTKEATREPNNPGLDRIRRGSDILKALARVPISSSSAAPFCLRRWWPASPACDTQSSY